jgi:hypothetical protein
MTSTLNAQDAALLAAAQDINGKLHCTTRTASALIRQHLAYAPAAFAHLTDAGRARGEELMKEHAPEAYAALMAKREEVRREHARRSAEYQAQLKVWEAEAAAKRAAEEAEMRAASVAVETDPNHTLYTVVARYQPVLDEELDRKAVSPGRGDQAEAEILRPLTPRVRALVKSEAMVRLNTSPGYVWSGALEQARRDVLAGRTPMGELNARLMAYDPDGTKAAKAAEQGVSWESFMRRA